MTLKNWPIYVPAFVALLVGFALWGLSEFRRPDTSSPPALSVNPLSVETSPTAPRLAAVPTNDAEWASVQKFVQDTWLIASRQGQAQEELKKVVAALGSKGDLNGVHAGFVAHMSKLEELLTGLDGLQTPKVDNEDTARFVAEAAESINATLVLEMEQTDWFIKGWDQPGQAPPENVIVSSNADINRNTAHLLRSLHKIYWNYGYTDNDIDERTFKLKPGAKPKPTVTFDQRNI